MSADYINVSSTKSNVTYTFSKSLFVRVTFILVFYYVLKEASRIFWSAKNHKSLPLLYVSTLRFECCQLFATRKQLQRRKDIFFKKIYPPTWEPRSWQSTHWQARRRCIQSKRAVTGELIIHTGSPRSSAHNNCN